MAKKSVLVNLWVIQAVAKTEYNQLMHGSFCFLSALATATQSNCYRGVWVWWVGLALALWFNLACSVLPLPRDLHQVTSLVQPNDLPTVKLVQKRRKWKYYLVGTTYLIRVSMLSLYRIPLTCSPSKCVDDTLGNCPGWRHIWRTGYDNYEAHVLSWP